MRSISSIQFKSSIWVYPHYPNKHMRFVFEYSKAGIVKTEISTFGIVDWFVFPFLTYMYFPHFLYCFFSLAVSRQAWCSLAGAYKCPPIDIELCFNDSTSCNQSQGRSPSIFKCIRSQSSSSSSIIVSNPFTQSLHDSWRCVPLA